MKSKLTYKIEKNKEGKYRVKIRHGGRIFGFWSVLVDVEHDAEGDPLHTSRIFSAFFEAKAAAEGVLEEAARGKLIWREVSSLDSWPASSSF